MTYQNKGGWNIWLNMFVSLFFIFFCRAQRISLPIPSFFGKLLYLIPVYFGIAVIYDVGLTIYSIVKVHTPDGDRQSSLASSILMTTVLTTDVLHNLTSVTKSSLETSTQQYVTNVFNNSDVWMLTYFTYPIIIVIYVSTLLKVLAEIFTT